MDTGEVIKILMMGDNHESAKKPDSRKETEEGYQETRKRKRQAILKLAKSNNVDAILHTGDFFDEHNPDMDYAGIVMADWVKSGIPLVGIVGNHDCFGNLNTWNKTLGKFISNVGLVNICSKEKPYMIERDGFKVAITGASHHLLIDSIPERPDYIVDEKKGDYHIHVVHGYLSVTKKPYHHTLIDSILDTKADFTLAGHDHLGFDTIYTNDKYFANPGAVARISADKKEISRIPKVLLVEISTIDGTVKVTEHEIEAEDGKKVLSRKKIEEKAKKERNREKVKSEIKKANITQHTTLEDIVKEIANTKSLEETLLQRTLDDIANKRMDLNQKKFNGTKILRIVLENFQRHKYTDLCLDMGLNMLVGLSGKGKSSILRGIDWVYENQPTGKRIIKKGEDFAKVTLYFDNGYVISRYTEKKTGGKNGFFIYNPETNEETFENTKSLPLVQEIIGHSILVIDKDYSIPLNFSKQGSSWFLIGDGYSPAVKAKLIGSLYDIHFADAVIRDIDKNTKDIEKNVKKEEKEIETLDNKISTYDYIDDIENRVEVVKTKMTQIQSLIKKKEEIQKLQKDYTRVTDVLEQIKTIFVATANLGKSLTKLNKVKELALKSHQLKTISTQYITVLNNQKQCDIILDDTTGIDKTFEILSSLKILQQQKEIQLGLKKQFVDLTTKNEQINVLIKQEEEVIDKTSKTKENLINLEKAKKLLEEQNKIKLQKNKIEENNQLIVQQDEFIKDQDEKISYLLSEYKEVLEEAGKCPVCHGTITNAVVEEIIKNYK